MKVTKFTLSKPDTDGSMSTDIAVSISNPTQHDIRWLQYNVVFSDKDGSPIQSSNDCTEDCTIEPGEDFVVKPWGSVPSQVAGTTRDNVTLTVSAVLHAREFYKLGEVEVPSTDFGHATLEKSVTSETIEGPVKVLLFREKMDDDGQVRVQCRVFVKSKCDLHLGRVEIKCELLDADDAVIDSNSDVLTLPARSIGCIESGTGWLKKSQFKDAKMRMALLVFKPIHVEQCTGSSSPAED